MPRGSKPGERRGGRKRATPNKRTVLTERILAAASAHPKATGQELLCILLKDQALPADTRMAIARTTFTGGASRLIKDRSDKSIADAVQQIERANHGNGSTSTNGVAAGARTPAVAATMLDVFWSIAQDATVTPAERRKAASQAALHLLPKYFGRKKSRRGKFPADEYGFAIDPKLARELRDLKLQLSCLPQLKKLTAYTIAQRATKLQIRIGEIQQSLQCPCPSGYGLKQIQGDQERVKILNQRRAAKIIFPREEDAEEAHRMARLDSFLESPEIAARTRLTDLRQKKRTADLGGRPLTRAQETELRFLAVLYPLPRRPSPDPESLAEHPFRTLPAVAEHAPASPRARSGASALN